MLDYVDFEIVAFATHYEDISADTLVSFDHGLDLDINAFSKWDA